MRRKHYNNIYMHGTAPKHFDGPTKYTAPEYGKKVQYEKLDTSPLLDKKKVYDTYRKYVENFYTQQEPSIIRCYMH
jgi:hypothetical protein